MADIDLNQLTNATTADNGDGVFDKLMKAVNLHIDRQYDNGRITGPDYASVYLGSIQSVISESVKFLLGEQQAGYEADLIYEKILSEQLQNGPGGLLAEQIAKIVAETKLILEKVETEDAQNKPGGLIDSQISKVVQEVALLLEKTESEAKANEPDGTIDLKDALIQAQTQGFVSDTKQKMLKLMLDGYAVNLSITQAANVPEATRDAAIDQLAQEMLTELSSSVQIQDVAETPQAESDPADV